jgi:molybdate transport system ATP-binding protein
LRDRLEIPVLYITHDPDEALLIGEVVIVLDAGRVVATGAPREVLWSRAVLPLSEALGLENVLDGRVVETGARESTVETAAGLRLVIPASLRPGESVRLGLRAQDLLLAADLPAHISARNVFQATVVHYELRGGDAFVHLEAAERLVAKITPTAVDKLALRAGTPVHVVVKAQAIHRLA